MSWPLSAAAWAALALILAVNWALVAALGSWLARYSLSALGPWLWAVLWSAAAFAAGCWTARVAGDLLSYTQWPNLAAIQMDSVFGPEGLGFILLAFNAALGLALWPPRPKPTRAALANVILAAALAASAWTWGEAQMRRAPKSPQGPQISIEMLQPNVDQYQKWNQAFVQSIWDDLRDVLSLPRRHNPALIVWPESSLPSLIADGQSPAEAALWSRRLNAYQIIGAVTQGRAGDYNSAILVKPDGSFGGVYHKRELVPFGEYVPLPFLRRFIGILADMGDLTPGGPRQPLFQTPLGPTGAAVCYEMAFPRLVRQDAARGARVIVNITDDAWYKDTWGPYQHFMISRFRAVENRVYVVRAGNDGISAVLDPWGRILAELPLGKRGRLDAQVPQDDAFPARSFYARHGDWFGALCLILTLAWAAKTLLTRLR